jgi:hypothetical protein
LAEGIKVIEGVTSARLEAVGISRGRGDTRVWQAVRSVYRTAARAGNLVRAVCQAVRGRVSAEPRRATVRVFDFAISSKSIASRIV